MITITDPIKWKGVNSSPKNNVANIAVIMGVSEKRIVAFETSK